jgi:hypothetical protein
MRWAETSGIQDLLTALSCGERVAALCRRVRGSFPVRIPTQ